MRRTLWPTLALGCGLAREPLGEDTASGPAGGTGTEADADADADTDGDPDPDGDPDELTDIRFLNVSPSHRLVDVILDETLPALVDGLAFADGTRFRPEPVGTHFWQVVESGRVPPPAYWEGERAILPGEIQTFVVTETHDGAMVLKRSLFDNRALQPGAIRLRWSHAAVDIPAEVDVADVDGTMHADDLAFGASMVGDFAAGVMNIGLDVDDDGAMEWQFQSFDLGSELVVDLYLVSEADGSPPFLVAHKPNGDTPVRVPVR